MTAEVSREPTISMQVLQGFVYVVERAGVPRAELLREAGISVERLAAGETRVPRSEAEQVFERALELTGDPALGLHWSEGLSHRTFGPVSHVLSYSASVREALALLSRFARFFTDEPFLELIEQADCATLRALDPTTRSEAVRRFGAEMMVAGFVLIVRSLSEAPRIDRMCFAYPAPVYHPEYARVLGQPVLFEQQFTGIVFDRALLDAPSPHRDEDMHSTLTLLAERRMQRITQRTHFSSRVHELLVKRAPARVNMAAVAGSLGLSVRSLRRRLADEGKSYLEIEYDALAFVATRLLREQRRTIQEAAYEMGFSDATTFHRAFKRWTGATPGTFQERASAKP